LEDIFCHQCTCELCGKGAHCGFNCPSKVHIIPDPEPFNNQTIDELPQTLPSFDPKCYSKDGNSFTYDSKSNLVHDSLNVFDPPPQPPLYTCEFCGNDARYGHYCTTQFPFYTVNHLIFNAQNDLFNSQNKLMEKLTSMCDMVGQYIQKKEKEKKIEEEQEAKARYWKNPVCYDDDDDDEDYAIAVTPILSIEEPGNSLSMGDEHLDTISATKSDELIKSSAENLVSILSESEGIHDNMCDASFHDNSPPLDVSKDQFEDFFDSNDDSTSIDDNSFSIDNIERILYEKLLNVNLLIANIEALKDNPTPSFDFMTKSSSTSLNFLLEETNTFDNSVPESETFYFDLEEISSGSTTTHSDSSLYDSFFFDLLINPFLPAGRSDFYEFADEFAHIISLPEYDCFCFKNEPTRGISLWMKWRIFFQQENQEFMCIMFSLPIPPFN
nr:hypothetical protein [Tanacetum cinerariifolium]